MQRMRKTYKYLLHKNKPFDNITLIFGRFVACMIN